MRDLYQFERCLMNGAFESLVTIPVTIGFFVDDAAFHQQPLQYEADIEFGVAGVSYAERHIFKITKNSELAVVRICGHGCTMLEVAPSSHVLALVANYRVDVAWR